MSEGHVIPRVWGSSFVNYVRSFVQHKSCADLGCAMTWLDLVWHSFALYHTRSASIERVTVSGVCRRMSTRRMLIRRMSIHVALLTRTASKHMSVTCGHVVHASSPSVHWHMPLPQSESLNRRRSTFTCILKWAQMCYCSKSLSVIWLA